MWIRIVRGNQLFACCAVLRKLQYLKGQKEDCWADLASCLDVFWTGIFFRNVRQKDFDMLLESAILSGVSALCGGLVLERSSVRGATKDEKIQRLCMNRVRGMCVEFSVRGTNFRGLGLLRVVFWGVENNGQIFADGLFLVDSQCCGISNLAQIFVGWEGS